jgi:uncharacterized membrane protein YfcA
MDEIEMVFPTSGIEIFPLWPPLVAFAISFFTSMGGVSGAFLLLPFQMSVLHFTSPAVSPTNLVFNIVAIPSGVYRYLREGRMCWALTWVIAAGTLPGVFLGFFLRVRFLPDPHAFKAFAGLVLLFIGGRLAYSTGSSRRGPAAAGRAAQNSSVSRLHEKSAIRTLAWSWRQVSYRFSGQTFVFNVPALSALSLAVGVIGGTYGIGGGAIIAPLLVSVFGLPVYTVAGACLMGTFLTSIAGVSFYSLIGPRVASHLAVSPDWQLGGLFGLGGLAGMYLGAKCQKYMPERFIKTLLAAVLLFLGVKYVLQLWL